MKTGIIALIVLLLLWKFRWEIIGLYIDMVEPRGEDDFPAAWLTISEEQDYYNLKKLIAESYTPDMLRICWQLIQRYQEQYTSFSALVKNSNLIKLFEEKESEIKIDTTLQNTISVENGF